ncbi:MAG: hypothetical protein WDO13_21010 [Verrucomicrobiota bacterium]
MKSSLLPGLVVALTGLSLTTVRAGDGPTTDTKDMKNVAPSAAVNASDAGLYIAGYGGAPVRHRLRQQPPDGQQRLLRLRPYQREDPLRLGRGRRHQGRLQLPVHPAGELHEPAAAAGGRGRRALHRQRQLRQRPRRPRLLGALRQQFGGLLYQRHRALQEQLDRHSLPGHRPGFQYLTTHGSISSPTFGGSATGLNTSDVDFAAEALVGFDVAVAPHFSIFTEYKFIDAIGESGKSDNLAGGTYRFKPDQIQQNLITAGIKYSF